MNPTGLSSPLDWPARFRAARGRAPRILHIGNIANYAYVNASLMRRHGVDAVVLDPDYYHFASAPEWIEARIAGELGDHFHPQWHRMRVEGFRRPEWFLNGPAALVLAELLAREQGHGLRRAGLAGLSRFYRRATAAPAGTVAPIRRLLEGAGPLGRTARAAIRVALGRRSGRPQAAPTTGGTPTRLPGAAGDAATRAALSRFDVIIGYALGAQIPARLGLPRFVALELGTLRGLPFEASEIGRLCAQVYRLAPEVFVTNLDCIDAALRLGIPPGRISAIPHPFDLDRALAFEADGTPPARPAEAPYFLCPARHHWRDGNASWLKGNDVLIRGAALAAAQGARFTLVMVEWGNEVALSRALIDECGLTARVRWIPPAPRLALWPMIAGAAAVLDQFAAQAIGGVALETMALGQRLVTRLDATEPAPFFRTSPPVIHAASPLEVARAMMEILADPADRRGLGLRGQEWMRAEHDVAHQLAPQFAACERLVARFGAAGPHG